MTSSGPVRIERDGDVAVITLAAPPINLFDEAMFSGLGDAIGAIEHDLPRAALLRAEGRTTSGGVDVHMFAGLTPGEAETMFAHHIALADRLHSIPCPTVFAAHALCLTAAFELALACDLLVAARSAQFGLVERVVGLTPGMGGTQRVADRAGSARAREMVMTGDLYPADTLERWNVVNRVFDDEGFDDAVRGLVGHLAVGPPLAHAATKQVLAQFEAAGVAGANEATPRLASGLFSSEDLQGAVRAFLEHGRPGTSTFHGH